MPRARCPTRRHARRTGGRGRTHVDDLDSARGWSLRSGRNGHRADKADTDIESAPLTATVEASPNHSPQPGAALMKRTTKYVGLDVHQATIVAVVRDETGRVIARTILPTEAAA